nr:MAG TPA: Myelin regulatory factor fold transcription factor, ER [Caudoviricetes sp.]
MPSGWICELQPPASSAPLIVRGRHAPSSLRSASG